MSCILGFCPSKFSGVPQMWDMSRNLWIWPACRKFVIFKLKFMQFKKLQLVSILPRWPEATDISCAVLLWTRTVVNPLNFNLLWNELVIRNIEVMSTLLCQWSELVRQFSYHYPHRIKPKPSDNVRFVGNSWQVGRLHARFEVEGNTLRDVFLKDRIWCIE